MNWRIIIFLMTGLCAACSESQGPPPSNEKTNLAEATDSDTSQIRIGTDSTEEESFIYDDCIFDIGTQTSDFLDSTKFAGLYNWNKETKTATVELDQGERLEINRGGCTHFNYSLLLVNSIDSMPITQHEYWIDKILVNLKEIPDFDYDYIREHVAARGKPANETESQVYWMPQQERYCSLELYIEIKEGVTSVYIGFYLC